MMAFVIALLCSILVILIYEGAQITLALLFPVLYETKFYFMDALACLGLMLLYAVLYRYLFPEKMVKKGHFSLLQLLIITLGLGGIAFVWFFLYELILSAVPFFQQSMVSFEETWSDLEQTNYLWVFLSVVLLGPITEELLFRGLVLRFFLRTGHTALAILLSSLLFGLWHMEPVQVVYTFFIGLGLAQITVHTGSLRGAILVHILNNFLSALPPILYTSCVNDTILLLSIFAIIPAIRILKRGGIKPPLEEMPKEIPDEKEGESDKAHDTTA